MEIFLVSPNVVLGKGTISRICIIIGKVHTGVIAVQVYNATFGKLAALSSMLDKRLWYPSGQGFTYEPLQPLKQLCLRKNQGLKGTMVLHDNILWDC